MAGTGLRTRLQAVTAQKMFCFENKQEIRKSSVRRAALHVAGIANEAFLLPFLQKT